MPRPWLPLYGLGTTRAARPARRAPPASADCTSSWRGTGRPSEAEDLVGFFLVAGQLHRDVRGAPITVAWMRCWYLPCPGCTSGCSLRRSHGMPRSTAAHERAVNGPSARRCAGADETVRSLFPVPAVVGGVAQLGGQRQRGGRVFSASSPACVPFGLRVFVHHRIPPGRSSEMLRVLPKVTSSPATFCSSMRHAPAHGRARCPRPRACGG